MIQVKRNMRLIAKSIIKKSKRYIMEDRSLSKRLDALSAQHGGKIPFGSMKGKGKGKGKTTRRRGNNSKIQRHTSKASQRKRSKKASKAKHKGEPSMSPKHIDDNVIQRGRDGHLYEVKRGKGETRGKWVKVTFGK